MTWSREFRPRNRIAEMINEPGGILIADALQRAHANIETLHTDMAAAIDGALARLQARAGDARAAPDDETITALYEIGNEIVGFAVTLQLRDMGRAAYSLCELLDRARAHQAWSVEAFAVHVEALRLLREPNGDALTRRAILDGLDRVLAVAAR